MENRKNKYHSYAAVGVLLFFMGIVWFGAVRPYVDYINDNYAYAKRLERQYASLTNLVENKKTINAQYRAMQNNRSLDQVFLSGGKNVLIKAKLQGLIKRKVSRSGCVMVQSSLISDDKKEHIVRLKLQVSGDVESTYKLLHDLEYGRPVLSLDMVEIQKQSNIHRYKISNSPIQTAIELTAYVKS